MKKAFVIFAAFVAVTANALTVEEARANLNAARAAYTNALHEAGITNTPRRTARARAKKAAQTLTARNTVLSRRQQSFFENRRICTRRDAETLPGYVISYWERNGKPDTIGPAVVTNAIQHIVGAEQSNPLQVLAERYRLAAVDATNRLAAVTADYMSASNRAERAEARHAAIVAWAEEQRDRSPLQTTKAIWQAIIDRLEDN